MYLDNFFEFMMQEMRFTRCTTMMQFEMLLNVIFVAGERCSFVIL